MLSSTTGAMLSSTTGAMLSSTTGANSIFSVFESVAVSVIGFNLEINSDSLEIDTFSLFFKMESFVPVKNIGMNITANKTRTMIPINLSFSC